MDLNEGPYVPIATKRIKPLSSRDLRKVKNPGEFDVMCRYTNHVMADIGRHIGDGQFPIQPYQLHRIDLVHTVITILYAVLTLAVISITICPAYLKMMH